MPIETVAWPRGATRTGFRRNAPPSKPRADRPLDESGFLGDMGAMRHLQPS